MLSRPIVSSLEAKERIDSKEGTNPMCPDTVSPLKYYTYIFKHI